MSAREPELRHPGWCDRRWCTADPAAVTAAGFMAGRGAGTKHRSAPMNLDLSALLGPGARPRIAYLERETAPWTCVTYVRVDPADSHDAHLSAAIPVSSLADAIGPLGVLIQAAAELDDPPAAPPDDPDGLLYSREDVEPAEVAPLPPQVTGFACGGRSETRNPAAGRYDAARVARPAQPQAVARRA